MLQCDSGYDNADSQFSNPALSVDEIFESRSLSPRKIGIEGFHQRASLRIGLVQETRRAAPANSKKPLCVMGMSSSEMCAEMCAQASPLWERAAQTAQQKEWVRGPPHPIEFVATVSPPSPTRGEGKAFHGACAARPGTASGVV